MPGYHASAFLETAILNESPVELSISHRLRNVVLPTCLAHDRAGVELLGFVRTGATNASLCSTVCVALAHLRRIRVGTEILPSAAVDWIPRRDPGFVCVTFGPSERLARLPRLAA